MDAAATKTTKKSGKASKATKSASEPMTLSQLADRWLKHLQQAGKSAGTIFSYTMDLGVAKDSIGGDTPIDSLTPERVQEFFESDAVTKTRKGRAKSPLTTAKTRRVLRLSLAFAVEKGWLEKAPLPVTDPSPTEA